MAGSVDDSSSRKSELINALINKLQPKNTIQQKERKSKAKEDAKLRYKSRMGESMSWIDNESQIVSQSKAHVKAINEITRKELNDILEESKGMSDDEMPSLLKKR